MRQRESKEGGEAEEIGDRKHHASLPVEGRHHRYVHAGERRERGGAVERGKFAQLSFWIISEVVGVVVCQRLCIKGAV